MMNIFQLGQFGRRVINQGGGGGGGGGNRTIVQLASDSPTFGSGTPVAASWPTPLLDELSAWSGGSPTRLTIPETGWYQAVGQLAHNSATGGAGGVMGAYIYLNGALFEGGGYTVAARGAASGVVASRQVATPPLNLTAGDYLEFMGSGQGVDSISGTSSFKTVFVLYKLAAAPEAAVVEITSNRTALNGNHTPSWDAEVSDTDELWSSGAPTLFTMNKTARASCNLNIAMASVGGTTPAGCRVLLNGSAVESIGGVLFVINQRVGLVTGPIPVANTNTLSSQVTTTDANWDFNAAGSSFGVEVHTDDCASATLSSNLTGVNSNGSLYYITWTSESFDDDSFFTTGTGQRMTCSADGFYQVGTNLWLSGIDDFIQINWFVVIEHYNSGGTLQQTYRSTWYGLRSTMELGCVTPQIECASGDYFRVGVQNSFDSSITILTTSKFWLRRFA